MRLSNKEQPTKSETKDKEDNKEASRKLKLFKELLLQDGSLTEEEKHRIIDLAKTEPGLRPKRWSNKSVASYYTPRHARWLKRCLMQMLKNPGNDLRFDCKDFGNISTKTLYYRFIYAWQFLTENYDRDGTFQALRTLVKVCQEGRSVCIRWRRVLSPAEAASLNIVDMTKQEEGKKFGDLVPRYVDNTGKKKNLDWQHKLLDFLENAEEGERLQVDSVNLSNMERESVFEQVIAVDDFMLLELNRRTFSVLCDSVRAAEWRQKL